MDIKGLKELADKIRRDYESDIKSGTSTDRWLQDFNTETGAIGEYRGREILELLQNADDAGSSNVAISFDRTKGEIEIKNWGPQTELFTYEGMKSIMLPNLSSKKGKRLIGAKGLGFRSLLNWSDRIEIRSGNMRAGFSEEITSSVWDKELRDLVAEAAKYEKQALQKGRKVPIAILAVPEIEEIYLTKEKETVITIHLDKKLPEIEREKRERRILEDMERFSPESLLFLPNIKSVEFIVDGKTTGVWQNEIIRRDGDVTRSRLDGKTWLTVHDSANIDKELYYDVACAVCLDGQEKSYPIHTFFPTKVEFEFPCILHATLELDSSRSSLHEDNEQNLLMMDKLADVMERMAKYLKSNEAASWLPYRLMRPKKEPFSWNTGNAYQRKLASLVREREGDYVPTLSAGYTGENNFCYLNDEFFDVACLEPEGKTYFPKMRLKAENGVHLETDAGKRAADKEIEDFAASVETHNRLADLILALRKYGLANSHSFELKIFRNENNEVIRGKTLVNTGEIVKNIPPFLKFDYLNSGLEAALKSRMTLKSGHPEMERDMAAQLSNVGDISPSEITYVTRNLLLPTGKDESRPTAEREEMIKSVFRLYLQRGGAIDPGETNVYLFDENGGWKKASELVMADSRFPVGFNGKGYRYRHSKDISAQFPAYLLPLAEDDAGSIELFYECLGVRKYFVPEEVNYAEDWHYLQSLPIMPEVRNNCRSWRIVNENISEVIPEGMVKQMEMTDLLKVIIDSGYVKQLGESQKIHWFLNTTKLPVNVEPSYALYSLRQSVGATFKHYIIDEERWLPGYEQTISLPYTDSEELKGLLSMLGAKRKLSDFSPEELYEAVNRKAEGWDGDGEPRGTAAFYHEMKTALEGARGFKGLPKDRTLRMFCRIGDRVEIRDSREIYYSDRDLSDNIKETLPILILGKREGEQKVKNIFGCRPYSSIEFHIENSVGNPDLQEQLNRHLERLRPIILAMVSEGVGRKGGASAMEPYRISDRNTLESLEFEIFEKADYRLEGVEVSGSAVFTMKENEMLIKDNKVRLCTVKTELEDALRDPWFVDAVIDALCMALRLSLKENHDRLYRILRLDERERQHYIHTEIGEDRMPAFEEAFGIPEREKGFWKKVFEANGKTFDSERLDIEKRKYLTAELGVTADIRNEEDFVSRHLERLKELRRNHEGEYIRLKHEEVKDYPDRHSTFISSYRPFLQDGWISEALAVAPERLLLSFDYEVFLRALMREKFGFSPKEEMPLELLKPLAEYGNVLDDLYSLDDAKRSLAYFPGHGDAFEFLRQEERRKEEETETPLATDPDRKISISVVELGAVPPARKKNASGGGGGGTGGSRPSEKRLKQLGNRAEDIVKAALEGDENYEIVKLWSKHLNDATGDDSKGYDLEYREKGGSTRYLEIKHSNGESIIISDNELKVAKKNSDRYDIALVVAEEVRILKAPFADEKKFRTETNDHTVYFKTL